MNMKHEATSQIIESKIFRFFVNYECAVEDAIRFSAFPQWNADIRITSDNFSSKKNDTPRTITEAKLVYFQDISIKTILHEIENIDHHPANLHEFLDCSRVYQEFLRQFSIIFAPGAVMKCRDKNLYVYAERGRRSRRLLLGSMKEDWELSSPLLVIRNK